MRAPVPRPATLLERLLLLTASGVRGIRVVTGATWSIERIVIEAVRPRHNFAGVVSSS